MRVIKFRQWTGDRFYYWGFGVQDDGEYFTGPTSGGSLRVADQIHEQFTGLTDANGVEIYEGDIVEDHVGVGVVKYSERNAGFRVSYGDGMAKWFYDYTLRGERESIVAIGNIHQNPELLEANNV